MGKTLSIFGGWAGTYSDNQDIDTGYIYADYDQELGPHVKKIKFILKSKDGDKQTIDASVHFEDISETWWSKLFQYRIISEKHTFLALTSSSFVDRLEGTFYTDDYGGSFSIILRREETKFL